MNANEFFQSENKVKLQALKFCIAEEILNLDNNLSFLPINLWIIWFIYEQVQFVFHPPHPLISFDSNHYVRELKSQYWYVILLLYSKLYWQNEALTCFECCANWGFLSYLISWYYVSCNFWKNLAKYQIKI